MVQPRANACTYTFLTLTPKEEAMRMSCEVARNSTPNLVR
jgi:hypothetical protein